MSTPDTIQGSSIDVNNPKFDQAGKNTVKAILNATQALQIATTLDTADRKRDMMRARVLAAFNGNPPYDEAEILAAAQSYRFNISFGFMEGAVGRGVVPYNGLALDNKYIANILADLSESKRETLREELNNAFEEWGRWAKEAPRLNQDLLLNGYNNLIWPTIYNPWPILVEQKNALVHDLTPNMVSELEVYVWKKSYMIHELFYQIEDEAAAAAAGWNIDNVRKALESASPESLFQRTQSGDLVKVEEALRGGALFATICGGKRIDTYHVFASQLGGKVDHFVCNRSNGVNGDAVVTEDPGVELFKKEGRFDSFEEFLVYFDMEPGDGTWHGSKGLGRRAYNTHLSIDKLRCGLLDQATLSGLTLLQLGDQSSQEDFNLTVAGPFCVIPAGVTISNTAIPTLSQQSFQMDGLLNATAESRFGDVVPNASGLVTPDKTATQSNIDANRNAVVTKGNLQRYTDPLSKTVSIIVKRLLKENSPNSYAQKFQACLKKRGFTAEDFKKVRGAQATGKIDSVMGTDAQAMGQMMQVYRGDPQVNQLELKRRHMASIIGLKEVEGLLIADTDHTLDIESERQQMEEVSTMLTFIPVLVSPRDNHIVHFRVITDWLGNQLKQHEAGKGGADQEVLQLAGEHAKHHAEEMHKDEMLKEQAKAADKTMHILETEFKRLESTPAPQQSAQGLPATPPPVTTAG